MSEAVAAASGMESAMSSEGPTMREPFRSQFVESVLRGAASRDIHDSDGTGEYDAALSQGVSERFLQRELTRVEMHATSLCAPLVRRLGAATRILDAGCGTGGTTVALALSGLAPDEVVGIDASAEAVEAGRIRSLGYGLMPERARFEHVPAGQRLPFPDGHFDLVTCVSVLEFISTDAARRAFVAELLRVTRSGGHVYLATPNPLRMREYHSRRWLGDWRRKQGYPWSSSTAALKRMFAGCQVESMVRERLRLHPRYGRLAWAAPLAAIASPWQRVLARKP
ncbi:MAG: class I SAM-dependent methyltransferase [Lysobacteraceae bacterium]|nr:MAG: class I SAM-dependent methyltransferase [Xanthomonadaceae bacterium]